MRVELPFMLLVALLPLCRRSFSADDCWKETAGESCLALYGEIEELPSLPCSGCYETSNPAVYYCAHTLGYEVYPAEGDWWSNGVPGTEEANPGDEGAYHDRFVEHWDCWAQVYCHTNCQFHVEALAYFCVTNYRDGYSVNGSWTRGDPCRESEPIYD